MKNIDFAIVGFGLSGAVLAFKLIQEGKKVLVIDPMKENTSSRVAVGMWNPIVFKRINKCWNADQIFPVAMETYSQIEDQIQIKIKNELPVIRLHPDNEYANDFYLKTQQKGFSEYISIEKSELFEKNFPQFSDYGIVKCGGWLSIKKMIEGLAKYIERGNFREKEELIPDEIKIEEGSFFWKDYSFDKVIFCRGHEELESGWFSYLPLRRTKGEVLDLENDNSTLPLILNNSKFMAPSDEKTWRAGSTYDHNFEDDYPTSEGRKKILDKAVAFLGEEVKVVGHKAGIRPTVKDRRPLVGEHKSIKGAYILNGMGTRGVLNAPWCCDRLIDNILRNVELPEDINVDRFKPTER